MILLNGHSLTPVRRLYLESQKLTLNERESVSDLSTTDTDGITMNSWLQDDTDPGAGIVWRVRSIKEEFATETTTVQLEHIINVLRDKLLFGEIKADTITGVTGATTCTALQAVNYILAQQSDWTLHSFDYASVTNAYTFDGDSLFDALVRVTETLDDAYWSYDTTVYPFRISITEKPAGTACEMRPGRNLVSVNRSIDRGGMYTRFYPIGKDDLHIPGNYVDKNTSLYGIVSHVETDTSRESVADLMAWANERLKRHAEPQVTTTADGLEIAEATGEPLDRLTLMRICRMPLPEYGTTIEERITELTYRDKIHEPTVVRITMGNQQEDIVKLIAREIKEGAGPSGSGRGGGGRGGARQEREDHAWFEDTDEHVAMCAEGIVGVDAQGNPNWTLLSQIIVDGTGVHQSVTEVKEDLVTAEASIEMNQYAIEAEVTRATGAESALSGRITVEAGKISQIVSAVGDDGQVTAASIVLAINNSTGQGEAKIDADHVYIGNSKSTTVIAGKLNTSDLGAKIADLASVTMMVVQVTGNTVCHGALSVGTSLAVNQNYGITAAGTGNFSGIKLGSYSSFSDCVTDASVANNVLTLTKASGGTVTFSKATTLTGAWSGGTFTATASPQGDTISSGLFSVAAADITWNGNTASFPVYANLQGGETRYNTGKTLSIDASSIYTNGYNDGYPSGTVTIGSKITGTTYNISISPTSGTAKASTIDFSSIYADARAGYTPGTFTLASVTLQGQRVTGTSYHTVETGGTVYYTAGSAVTRLGSSVTPTSVSGYRRGSSVSMSRDTIYRQGTGGVYTKIGYCYFCDSTAGASTLYKGGDYFNYHDVGTSSTLYYAGSSVTPISGGGLRLSTVTAYQAGSTVSDTYYTKS